MCMRLLWFFYPDRSFSNSIWIYSCINVGFLCVLSEDIFLFFVPRISREGLKEIERERDREVQRGREGQIGEISALINEKFYGTQSAYLSFLSQFTGRAYVQNSHRTTFGIKRSEIWCIKRIHSKKV